MYIISDHTRPIFITASNFVFYLNDKFSLLDNHQIKPNFSQVFSVQCFKVWSHGELI